MIGSVPIPRVTQPHKGSYIGGIEGLRGISVLAVLFYHLSARLVPGGFVGVDIFFVISGFVVALATSSVSVNQIWSLAAAFYRRRFVRIGPALLTFLVIVQLLAVLFIPTVHRLVDGDRTSAGAAIGASNFVLWWWGGDYFSPGPELNPFTHTWSLAVEEQFYFTFPFFVWLIWRAGGRLRQVGLALLGLAIAASLVAAAALTQPYPTLSFYMLPTRFWELGAGMLLYAVIGRGRELPAWLLGVLQVGGLALLVLALVATNPERVPFPDIIVSVLAALALITVSTCGADTPVSRLLSLGWLRYFGKISYSLYLWHWGVLVLMRWTVGVEELKFQLLAIAASWLAAHLSWRFIEKPVRGSARIAGMSNLAVIVSGLLAIAITIGAIGATVLLRSSLTLSVTGNRDDWLSYRQQTLGSCRVVEDAVAITSGHRATYARTGCEQPTDSRKLFALGDSHVMVYQRMFGNVALRNGVTSYVYTESGCAEFPGVLDAKREQHCRTFRDAALADIVAQARKGDWLFMPGLRSTRLCDADTPDTVICGPTANRTYDDAALAQELARLRPLLDRGVRVIFEAPKPLFPYEPMRCADWFNKDNPACRAKLATLEEQFQKRAHAMGLFARIRAADPRIELWDPFSLLCNQPVCQPLRNGRPLFVDSDHVSGYTNDLLTAPFEQLLGLGTKPAAPPKGG